MNPSLPLDVMWLDTRPEDKNIGRWYYQLRATRAIFPKTNQENEYSRFQHLGKAGSQAHIDGVLSVVRRNQIDAYTQAIETLKESWLDLYNDEEKVGHRVK